jgi:transketolase
VIRPADATETAEAWTFAVQHDGPTLLALTRQNLPHLDRSNAAEPNAAKGAYILSEADGGSPQVILIGTGSEVSLCMKAQRALKAQGVKARVVSMPCWSLFAAQAEAYRQSVLPRGVRKRVTVEAGSTFGWHRWAGDEGVSIGVDRFGASAPGEVVMKNLGLAEENVVATALRLFAQ